MEESASHNVVSLHPGSVPIDKTNNSSAGQGDIVSDNSAATCPVRTTDNDPSATVPNASARLNKALPGTAQRSEDSQISSSVSVSLLAGKHTLPDRRSHKITSQAREPAPVSRLQGPKPGAVAVAGMATESAILSSDSPVHDDYSIGGEEHVHDLESNQDEIEPATTAVLKASVVDENFEMERLRQAEDYGRQQILRGAVVAEALPMQQRHDDVRSGNKYGYLAGLLAMIVSAAVIAAALAATRKRASILVLVPTASPTPLNGLSSLFPTMVFSDPQSQLQSSSLFPTL